MKDGPEFPCPYTNEACTKTTCPPTACGHDLELVARVEWLEETLQRHVEAGDALLAVACSCYGDKARAASALWRNARGDDLASAGSVPPEDER